MQAAFNSCNDGALSSLLTETFAEPTGTAFAGTTAAAATATAATGTGTASASGTATVKKSGSGKVAIGLGFGGVVAILGAAFAAISL